MALDRAVLKRAGLEPAERNALLALAHCRGDVDKALIFLTRRGDYTGETGRNTYRGSGPKAKEFLATVESARAKIARALARPPAEEEERPRTFRPSQTRSEEEDVERRELIRGVLERAREPLTIDEIGKRVGDGSVPATRSMVYLMANEGLLKRFGRQRSGRGGAPPTLFGLPEWPMSDYAPAQPAPRRHVRTSAPADPPAAPSPPVESAPPAAQGPEPSRQQPPDPEPSPPVTPPSGAGVAAGTPPAEGSGADSPPPAPPAAEAEAALDAALEAPPAVAAFLYLLMRDGLPVGRVRSLIDEAVRAAVSPSVTYTTLELEELAKRYGLELILAAPLPSDPSPTVRRD